MFEAVRKSTTPIATGERLIAAYGCADVIDMGVVDILQPDIAHVGGITALWKVSAAAEAAGIRMAPHACEGPVGGLASLHVDAATPNFLGAGDLRAGQRRRNEQGVGGGLLGFPAMRMVDGRYPMLPKPGLGFEVSEDALKRYPFQGRGRSRPRSTKTARSHQSNCSRRVFWCVSRRRAGRHSGRRFSEAEAMAVSSVPRALDPSP